MPPLSLQGLPHSQTLLSINKYTVFLSSVLSHIYKSVIPILTAGKKEKKGITRV